MPTQRPRLRSSTVATRERYNRTSGDFLVNDPDGFPSDYPPIHWIGSDVLTSSGSPIGPHGPFASQGAGLPVITRAVSLICGPLTAAPFKVQELGFGGQPLGRPRWITDPMLLRPDSRFVDDVFPEASKAPRGEFYFSWIRDAHFGESARSCARRMSRASHWPARCARQPTPALLRAGR